MATKEDLHKLKITPIVTPTSESGDLQLRSANIATALALDTEGYESNMLVWNVKTAGTDMVVGLYENDTDTSTLGTVVTGKDVIFAADNNLAAYLGAGTLANNTYPTVAAHGWVQSTGYFSPTTAPSGALGRCFMFAYLGNKRYIRLVATDAGSTAMVHSVIAIQGHFRYQGRGGLYVEPYNANVSGSA